VNKLRTTGLLIDKEQKHKRRVLTEGKSDDIGARLEHTPRKSLKHLAQETGVSKSGNTIAEAIQRKLVSVVLQVQEGLLCLCFLTKQLIARKNIYV
jgi:hypothetical protein